MHLINDAQQVGTFHHLHPRSWLAVRRRRRLRAKRKKSTERQTMPENKKSGSRPTFGCLRAPWQLTPWRWNAPPRLSPSRRALRETWTTAVLLAARQAPPTRDL